MIRDFGINEFYFLLYGAQWTVLLSLIAFVGGGVGGFVVALCRTSSFRFLAAASKLFIEFFQGTPLLMQLFIVYFGLALFGAELDPWLAAAVALTLHAGAFLGQIWRGCIEAVPRGQSEAATALGLGYWNRMIYVLLPQAAKISLAPTVGFLVQLIKGTSLTAIIGFTELARSGQLISNATFQPLLTFGIVAAIYFVMCWPLSLLSGHLERRFRIVER